jgi:uncharacterized protein YerC
MKFLAFVLLTLSLNSFAQQPDTIDDLGGIDLRVDTATTPIVDVHYPNYRLGGGTPPRMRLMDCFILDIQESDRVLTLADKLKVAKLIVVKQGFRHVHTHGRAMPAEIKGTNVVFHTDGHSLYMTSFSAQSRDGRDLRKVIDEAVGVATPVGLVYVRNCRF